MNISNAVLEVLTNTCPDCGDMIIDQELFTCFPMYHTRVTYRARVEGTSQTESTHLASLLEEWVTSGEARITVAEIQMNVDPKCLVAIPSLTAKEECEALNPTTSGKPSSTVTPPSAENSPAAIIGGVVAIIIISLIIATSITVVVVVIVNRRQERKTGSVWKTEKFDCSLAIGVYSLLIALCLQV